MGQMNRMKKLILVVLLFLVTGCAVYASVPYYYGGPYPYYYGYPYDRYYGYPGYYGYRYYPYYGYRPYGY